MVGGSGSSQYVSPLADGEVVPAGWGGGSTRGSWDVMLGEDWAMTEHGVSLRVCVIAVRECPTAHGVGRRAR